jgi:UDP-N-acetylglucosamine/UDP-N-acetylgalactosamine diphosphorylase
VTRDDKALRAAFCESEQGHVFRFFDDLSSDEQATLLAQLQAIDLKRVRRLIEKHLAAGRPPAALHLAPAPVIPVATSEAERRDEAKSRKAGEEALKGGHVAVLVVAGGQATRLGYDAPKGTFPIGPVSAKSLFQIHAEKVLALSRRHGKPIPLLILVSADNHAATRRFFEERGWFGLDPKGVRFFEQGMLPALDRDGRLLLAERGRIFLSPDGHGGVFRALHGSGTLDFLAKRAIETVFYFQVDNPLVKVADPVFLGHHLRREAEFSLKVVAKRNAAEKVGVFALVDGKAGVVEYSDLPAAARDAKGPDGKLLYGAGSIAIHAFSLAFLRRLGRGESELPYHVARKKVPYVDERGEQVQPAEQNGLKFESFVFDGLAVAKEVVAMEVLRSEEFAPVKNKTGEDSPESAIQAQSNLFRSWLEEAGMRVEDPAAKVEIGPLFALDRAELSARLKGSQALPARRILVD